MYDGSPGGIALGSSYRVFELLGVNCITIGIPKAWSGFRSGISTSNMLILRTFKINSNDDTADNHGSRIQGNRKASIHQSAVFVCTCRTCASSRGLNATKHLLFSCENSLRNHFVHSMRNMVFFTKEAISINYFWSSWDWELLLTPKAQIQDGRNNNTLDCNIFWVYTHS